MTTVRIKKWYAGSGTRYAYPVEVWSLTGNATFSAVAQVIAYANRMRDAKIAALEKQLAKLRAMTFEVKE